MGWSVDLRTAIVFSALLTWLTDVLLLLSWNSLPRAMRPSLRWWLLGMALHPVGFLLLSLGDTLPESLSIVAANTVLALAMSCMATALRIFYGLPERRAWLFGLPVLVVVLSLWFTYAVPSLHWRVVWLSLLLGVLIASCARAVFRRDVPLGTVGRFTGSLFALAGALMLARAVHEAWWPTVSNDLLQTGPFDLAGLSILVLMPVLATVGFLLMCTERSQEELERTARIDYLTGIFNRRAIEDLAARAISASRRHGIPMAIMLVDIDRFKRINDEYGHEAGDQALIEAVRRMREVMRAEDLVGRQGGEEFVAVMPDIDLASARAAAERLRRSFADRPMTINRPMSMSGDGLPIEIAVTVSIGVAALQPGDRQYSHLLRRADRAMYAAKAAGRNRVMLDVDAD